jgi:hypothetical protein
MRAMLFVVTFVLFVGELDARKRRGKPTPVTKKQSLRQRLTRPNLSEAELRQKLALELIDVKRERDSLASRVGVTQKALDEANKQLKKLAEAEVLAARLEQQKTANARKVKWAFGILLPLTALFSWLAARRKYKKPKPKIVDEVHGSLSEAQTTAS